jgi:hypothetical protein
MLHGSRSARCRPDDDMGQHPSRRRTDSDGQLHAARGARAYATLHELTPTRPRPKKPWKSHSGWLHGASATLAAASSSRHGRRSRAAGVERFVISYAERTPLGPRRVNLDFDKWPLWAKTLASARAGSCQDRLRPAARSHRTMIDRSRREDVDMQSEDHGFELEAMNQYADRINGFAAELESHRRQSPCR